MLVYAAPLAAGNAVVLLADPPADAQACRVVRDDVVVEQFAATPGQRVEYVDHTGLINGQAYAYALLWLIDGEWADGGTATLTPAVTYSSRVPDAMTLVMDRIDLGLRIEVERGDIEPPSGGVVSVLRAPTQEDNTRLPLVTVEFAGSQSDERALGEIWNRDDATDDGNWIERAGWMRREELVLVAWTLNPDQRHNYRRALERILLANLPIFEAGGLLMPEYTVSDQDLFTEHAAPIHAASLNLSYRVLVEGGALLPSIADIQINGCRE